MFVSFKLLLLILLCIRVSDKPCLRSARRWYQWSLELGKNPICRCVEYNKLMVKDSTKIIIYKYTKNKHNAHLTHAAYPGLVTSTFDTLLCCVYQVICPTHHIHWVLTHWDRDKMDAISQTTFSSAFYWMEMYELQLKIHWSLFLRVQLTIFQHWFG